MRTNIDIDDTLLVQAMAADPKPTYRDMTQAMVAKGWERNERMVKWRVTVLRQHKRLTAYATPAPRTPRLRLPLVAPPTIKDFPTTSELVKEHAREQLKARLIAQQTAHAHLIGRVVRRVFSQGATQ